MKYKKEKRYCGVQCFNKSKIINLNGKRFGELTVVKYVGQNKFHSAVWNCDCSCGVNKEIDGSSLRNGAIKTCGNFSIHRKGAKHQRWEKDRDALNKRRAIGLSINATTQRIKRINRDCDWGDKAVIKRKYRTAKVMSNLGSTKYEVDHIIPLQGQLVSGFHHEDNLQILTAKDNHEKSNKFIPYVEIFKNNKITKEYIQC